MQIPDAPLFVRTHDFNVWLPKHKQRFPKNFPDAVTLRLERMAVESEERILLANAFRGCERRELLLQADGLLTFTSMM